MIKSPEMIMSVWYITPADHSDHIISHVLTEIDGHSESMTIKDYQVQ